MYVIEPVHVMSSMMKPSEQFYSYCLRGNNVYDGSRKEEGNAEGRHFDHLTLHERSFHSCVFRWISPHITFLVPFNCSSPKDTEENLGSTGSNPTYNWHVPLCALNKLSLPVRFQNFFFYLIPIRHFVNFKKTSFQSSAAFIKHLPEPNWVQVNEKAFVRQWCSHCSSVHPLNQHV